MVFIGQDWRSPGERWVKTHKGSWERYKLLDNGSQFLGFQSSDSSSLDSDSSISDNENGSTFMESESSIVEQQSSANQQQFGDNLNCGDENSSAEGVSTEKLNRKVLKENIFLLNQPLSKVQKITRSNEQQSRNDHVVKRSMVNAQQATTDGQQSTNENECKIIEFNSKLRRAKNTSIQMIISQWERQQQLMVELPKKSSRIERQSSFDEIKVNLKPSFLRSNKQRLLFPSKSIDQPMDLENEPVQRSTANKFGFVERNFEKSLKSHSANKTKEEKIESIYDKKIEKSSKNLTIKQCIRKIDLNTTHQNIMKHLENDESLDQEEFALNKPSNRTINDKSCNELTQLNTQPHCPIILKHTREICGYNSLSECFLRLDFYNAIRDIRRFNYVCKLLHLLITQNLTSLSGCATKFLFTLLEEIAFQVAGNQQNIHILHTLLRDVQKIMKKYYCWGRPIGSTVLWAQHIKTIENICKIVKNIEIKPPPENGKGFRDLPAELIRTILLQLSDYKDLINSGQVNDSMKSFLDEQYIWRELCKYHYQNRHIKQFLKDNQGNKYFILERPLNETVIRRSNADNLNWEKVFHSLRKKFGLKEEYADSLFLCRHCRSLFWRQLGHPCLIAQMLEEINKENSDEQSASFRISNDNNNNNLRIQERIQQVRPMNNPLINNQIDLNRQINNLNRVNNNIVNEIRQANNERESRYVPLSDSVPISPESFLNFFSL